MPKYQITVIYDVLAANPHDAIHVLAKQTTDLIASKSDELRERLGHQRICKEIDCQVREYNQDGTVTSELI